MLVSPVMKQYTSTPQHTVRAASVTSTATCPPHVSVSPAPPDFLRDSTAPAIRHTMDTATPANATSTPIKPIVGMYYPFGGGYATALRL